MHTGRLDAQILVDDDAVELRHRVASVEARSGRRDMEMRLKIL